ncbi:MAG TPA: TetR/AcrR family transcriptional regulator C-terminal domain-containing protein, partial [Candidatus Binataceae bacterium]|nr:TetR/AcrR family transcriptional regulator C-terminal domain-containing protein [Candidatus Binataceae bacterium]
VPTLSIECEPCGRSQDLECGSRCVIQRNFPAPAWLDLKTFAPQPEHVVDVVTTEALTSRDPVEALRATCAWILHATDNDLLIAFLRLCIAEAAKLPAVSSTFVRMNDRLEGDVQALVERAQRVGAFPGRDPANVASALLGTFMSNPINRITIGDQRFREPAFRQRYFERCWQVFVAA